MRDEDGTLLLNIVIFLCLAKWWIGRGERGYWSGLAGLACRWATPCDHYLISGGSCLIGSERCGWSSVKGLNVLFISTERSIFKQTNIPCSCARSFLFFQKISEYCVNMRPWGPWRPSRGLYRRAASLLGWKLPLSQLFFLAEISQICFWKNSYKLKSCWFSLKKNTEELVNKSSALRYKHYIEAL